MLAEALAPIFLYAAFGMALRVGGIVKMDLAPTLFRFVFVATLPFLVFTSISRAPLDAGAALLPFAGFLTNSGCGFGAFLYGRWRGLSMRDTMALVLSCSIINMMLMFPFVLYGLGEAALSDAILFDVGNSVYVSTVGSAIAVAYGREGKSRAADLFLDLVRAPIFIAVAAALLVNLGGFHLSPFIYRVTEPLGAATIPLILVALGIALSPAAVQRPWPVVPILLRMGLGLVLGIALAMMFGFEGMTRWVVIASAAAPVGAGSVALAAIGRFDVERATAAVTLSVAMGFFSVTILLWLARLFAGLP